MQAAAIEAHLANRFDEAADLYRAVLASHPEDADALNLLALVERERGNLATAPELSGAARARFEHPTFLDNLAVSFLVSAGRFEEAAIVNRRLVTANPKDPGGINNLGLLAHLNGYIDEAAYHYERAITIDPDFEEPRLNLLVLQLETGHAEAAETQARRVIEADPGHGRARLGLSHALFIQGRWAEAWAEYQHRPIRAVAPPGHAVPPWNGEPLDGRRFLVVGEEGLGDHIQFARYAARLRARGASAVIVAAPKALHRLLLRMEGIDAVTDDVGESQGAEAWAPLMSLPLHFATNLENLRETLPRGLPYLRLDGASAPDRQTPLQVGIFWAGYGAVVPRELVRIDSQRSMELQQLLPLLLDEGLRDKVVWTILQRDRRPDYLEPLAVSAGWRDPFGSGAAGRPEDMLDTARIIAGLDLVIGVDSALIHVSGALGRPTWMMDRWNHCWRWRHGATDSDWYPGVLRIFRQQTAGDWAPVVAAVRDALARLT